MAPVVKMLSQQADLKSIVCVTGQHRGMLDQVLNAFEIVPDIDLDVMEINQSIPQLSAKAIESVSDVIQHHSPDLVLVHGDTATSAAAAMAAYFSKVPIGHVEAGLRTNDIYSPWPEEGNRRVVSSLAALHFAPTQTAKANLIAENVAAETVFVTGNTVIDALLLAAKQTQVYAQGLSDPAARSEKKTILVTAHRRENFGERLFDICQALLKLAEREDVEIIFPVHPNPNVADTVYAQLNRVENIRLIKPVDYFGFVELMCLSHIIITDSGGIQEEAPSLGKPVLVLRDVTERPEAVNSGTVKLVGADAENIVKQASWLIDDERAYQQMSSRANPYGDGKASQRIVSAIRQFLSQGDAS